MLDALVQAEEFQDLHGVGVRFGLLEEGEGQEDVFHDVERGHQVEFLEDVAEDDPADAGQLGLRQTVSGREDVPAADG